jgi:hypothetical protein
VNVNSFFRSLVGTRRPRNLGRRRITIGARGRAAIPISYDQLIVLYVSIPVHLKSCFGIGGSSLGHSSILLVSLSRAAKLDRPGIKSGWEKP